MKEVRQRRVVCVSLDLAGDSKLFKGSLEARGQASVGDPKWTSPEES